MTYIGHSQGTAQVFSGASRHPELYEDKINLMVALAPIASVSNTTGAGVHSVTPYWRAFEFAAKKLGAYNIIGVNWWEDAAIMELCNLFDGICAKIIQGAADSSTDVDNLDRLNVFLENFPAGSGYKTLVYFMQDV